MTFVWLEVAREAGEPPVQTERRELPEWVSDSFAENGMPLSMLDRQGADYARAWLRAMLAVRITDDDRICQAIAPIVDDCTRNPRATMRVTA